MAIQLEQEIMKKIGLGLPFDFFDGSNSCARYRNAALEKLPQVIKDLNKIGKVAPLNETSMKILRSISAKMPENAMREFWQATGQIIQTHIQTAKVTQAERQRAFARIHSHLVPNMRGTVKRNGNVRTTTVGALERLKRMRAKRGKH